MKKYGIALALVSLMLSCGLKNKIHKTSDLAQNSPIKAIIDISEVNNDRVSVNIDPGRFTSDTIIFRLPRVIQGTYSVSNFGSFIDSLKAIDYKGEQLLSVSKIDTNSWSIVGAKNLDKISYLVNDTFDVEDTKTVPFSPGGTNIDPENYLLNLHGFVGYFDLLKSNKYLLDVISKPTMKSSSALQMIKTEKLNGKVLTEYFANNYFDITDNPMMYGDIDIVKFNVDGIKVELSVYSPNKIHSASSLKKTMYRMMKAQKKYLGDLQTTTHYNIFLYLSPEDSETSPKGFGALEHNTSTTVVLPEESSLEELEENMIDVVSHEFFHILTPLTVHSPDIQYFDYNQPTFSKHLWMYEGVTEYFAQHFQIYEKLVDEEAFYETLMEKIETSLQMDDTMSFTEMSENILEKPYSDNYYNVYQKGALIAMCIDILMREESMGKRSLLSLMKELSSQYGRDKPFVDDNLIQIIKDMSYPSIGEFLEKHVVGKEPIDYYSFFKKVGIKAEKAKKEIPFFSGSDGFIFAANPDTGEVVFSEAVSKNSFWVDSGIQPLDILKEVDGQAVSVKTGEKLIRKMMTWKPGQKINVKISRAGKIKSIDTEIFQPFTIADVLLHDPEASSKKIELRKAWLGENHTTN